MTCVQKAQASPALFGLWSPCVALHFGTLKASFVCLRMLIRKCVYENDNKDEIQKVFPDEVLPEIQRLLTLLLQKFHREWREDLLKEQIQNNTRPNSGETDVNFLVSKDELETMLKSMSGQLSETGDASM
ncbi:uncharacterized protein LOC143543318 [Bidens hawaiensis]|uniref:uncharacterized protein LOC143543318 n=1 Tax=Bidens hawaiensis TaxID=980011 RepID=UPI00404B1984